MAFWIGSIVCAIFALVISDIAYLALGLLFALFGYISER